MAAFGGTNNEALSEYQKVNKLLTYTQQLQEEWGKLSEKQNRKIEELSRENELLQKEVTRLRKLEELIYGKQKNVNK